MLGMDQLGQLFGSSARLKILRLFIFNDEYCAPTSEVRERLSLTGASAQVELKRLERIGFLKKKMCSVEGVSGKKRRVSGWAVDTRFKHLLPLRSFLLATAPMQSKEIAKTLQGVGTVKLIIVSGIFLQNWESRLDLLIVGDNIKEKKLQSAIKKLEALLGKELRFAVFPTEEFTYRRSIYDKLLRDVLDFEYHVVLNRLPNQDL